MKSDSMKFQFSIFSILLLSLSFSQDRVNLPRSMDLEECIHWALSNSPRAQIYKHEFEEAYWDHKSNQADYKPQISFRGTLPSWNESLDQVQRESGGESNVYQSTVSSSVDLSISQAFTPTGGRLFASSNLNRYEYDLADTLYHTWIAQPFSIGFTQPIFKPNQYRWNRKTQNLEYEQSLRQHEESMAGLAIDVVRTFFDFYIAGLQLENAHFNRAVNDTIFNISQGRYTVGKIAENDLLRSELAVMNSRNTLDQTQLDYEQAYTELVTLLGFPVNDSIILNIPDQIPVSYISQETALVAAKRNRSEYIGWELQVLEAEKNTKNVKADHRFQMDLTASVGFTQTADQFEKVYDSPLDERTVTLNFDMPLSWGKRHAELLSAKTSEERNRLSASWYKDNFEQDLIQEVDDFNLLYRQLQISARSDTIATMQFEVAKNRYLIGKIDITNLFNAQNEKDNARRQYYQYLKNTWVAYFQLRQKTMYDFENGMDIQSVE